jgi:transposase-like protein
MDNQEERVALKRTQKDYSLPFKLQVISEVEKGELTWKQSQKKYGIQGRSTVLVWLRKHGSLDWHSKAGMKASKNTPNAQIRALEARIKRLEAEKRVLNSAIDIADESLGTDIRKKYLPLLLNAGQQGQDDSAQPEC